MHPRGQQCDIFSNLGVDRQPPTENLSVSLPLLLALNAHSWPRGHPITRPAHRSHPPHAKDTQAVEAKMVVASMAQLLLKAFAVCAVVGTVVALPTAEVDTPAQTCTNPSKRRSW